MDYSVQLLWELQKSGSDWLVTRQATEEYLLCELEIPYVHPWSICRRHYLYRKGRGSRCLVPASKHNEKQKILSSF